MNTHSVQIVSEIDGSGMRKEQPIPCFRCLFEKPISDGWCDPATCEMIEYFLRDKAFSWDKYYSRWITNLKNKNSVENGLKEEY